MNVTAKYCRLVNDPEYTTTKNGKPMFKFRFAVNERRKNEQGEYETTNSSFYSAVAYNDTADGLAMEGLKKGSAFHITGAKLVMEEWEDKQGNKRLTPNVTIFEYELPE
jgi:single-strand DNA-binding protein